MDNLNIEKIVIAYLDANKGSGWQVFGDMPKDRPEKFILVDRTGGPREQVVQDRAEILIEVYHKTSREVASDEAYRIADLMPELVQVEAVMRSKVTSVVKLDDLLGQYQRYQIYVDVYYRRGLSDDPIIPVIPGEEIDGQSIEYDLSDKIAKLGGGYLDPTGVIEAKLFYTKSNRWIRGSILLVISETADWGDPPEGLPGHCFAFKGEDLPYAPRQLAVDNPAIGEAPQPMGFALMNTQANAEVFDPTQVTRHGLGSAASTSGGIFGNTKPVLIMFKASDGLGSILNLPIDGFEGVEYVGRYMTLYMQVGYEIEPEE